MCKNKNILLFDFVKNFIVVLSISSEAFIFTVPESIDE